MSVSRIQLHPDGPQLARIVPGLMRLNEWNLTPPQLLEWIRACIDLGMTSFDHADIYGGYTCETRFGEALALDPGLRSQIELVSKCGIMLVTENRPNNYIKHYDTSSEHILRSVDESLRALHTDYLDVLLIHRPDPLMDPYEIAEAFSQLQSAGKVRAFGVSNFSASQFDLLQSALSVPLVTNQIEASVSHTDSFYDGSLDQCQRLRIAPMAWSPLGGGSIFNSHDERWQDLRTELQRIADELGGVSMDQVALAWLLAHPARFIPVLGTGKLSRIKAAAEAETLQLSKQQWYRILAASQGHGVP